jgi:hypothetical protein
MDVLFIMQTSYKSILLICNYMYIYFLKLYLKKKMCKVCDFLYEDHKLHHTELCMEPLILYGPVLYLIGE